MERASNALRAAGVEDAKVNAEYLASHVLGLKRKSEIRSYFHSNLSYDEEQVFQQLVDRRIEREPLQYILGEWEFFGLPIKVTPAALIPRPETEVLVEESLKEAASFDRPISILDIGTGSGAIALALAARLPRAYILGIDSSAAAIGLANENKRLLPLANVDFHRVDSTWSDWTTWLRNERKFDLVVSNPPYVSLDEFQQLEPELRRYEPRQALTDESTGLTFYERIARVAPGLLASRGRLLVELGYKEEEAVLVIMQSNGLEVTRVVNDLDGIPRVLVAYRLGGS